MQLTQLLFLAHREKEGGAKVSFCRVGFESNRGFYLPPSRGIVAERVPITHSNYSVLGNALLMPGFLRSRSARTKKKEEKKGNFVCTGCDRMSRATGKTTSPLM